MPPIKNIWRKYIWEEIKEDRGFYYVVYCPINLQSHNFAILELVFTTPLSNEKIVLEMEKELEKWISRFPVPLMVIAFDEKGDKISFDNLKPNNELIGYLENDNLIKSWNKVPEKAFGQVTDEQLRQIYDELPFKTRREKEEKAEERLKEKKNIKKLLDITLLSWLFILILISYLGWQNYWIGALAFFYSLFRIIRRGFKLFGCKTKKEIDKQDKERKKNHYYYHCELNPTGFAKLRAENFELQDKERIKEEKNEIKKT